MGAGTDGERRVRPFQIRRKSNNIHTESDPILLYGSSRQSADRSSTQDPIGWSTMSEEDWFEQALRELEGEEDDTAVAAEADAVADDAVSEETDDPNKDSLNDNETGDLDEDATDNLDGDATDHPNDNETNQNNRTPQADASHVDDAGTESIPDSADPFGISPGSNRAKPNREPTVESQGDTVTGADTSGDPFGSSAVDAGSSEDAEFGFADFSADPDSVSGSGDEDGPVSGEDGFDNAAFESSIDRIDLGIEGLDQMILGGVPDRSLMVVVGSAGTGKTTFGLQFLNHGLEQGERAVFITLEQSSDAIFSTAEEMGWPFREHESAGTLAVVSLDPIEMANSLSSLSGDISRLIDDFGADRLVLDSVSLLEMMYDHPAKRRSEVFDFTRSLKRAGVTTMLTSEASEDNPYASRHGIVEYLTDAVFVLQYVRQSNQETRLAVEIQKIRNANHSRETKPYEITDSGISVYRQASIF